MLKKQKTAFLYKKNILIIIPSLSGGGAEKIASNLANLFKKGKDYIIQDDTLKIIDELLLLSFLIRSNLK